MKEFETYFAWFYVIVFPIILAFIVDDFETLITIFMAPIVVVPILYLLCHLIKAAYIIFKHGYKYYKNDYEEDL